MEKEILTDREVLLLRRKLDLLLRTGKLLMESAADTNRIEQNISYSFDVQVIVDELNYQGRAVRSIVPVALRGNAV